jgi:aminopeptidase N
MAWREGAARHACSIRPRASNGWAGVAAGFRVLPTAMLKRALRAMPVLLCLSSAPANADTYPRQPGVDAVHYVFRLTVSDTSDEIVGECTATLKMVAPDIAEVFFDLTSAAQGKGMTVSGVTSADGPLQYTHTADRLRITLPRPAPAGRELIVTVRYSGVPADGLRLMNNIHGERTMFSESWPNRARQWLPTIDHPYDKATGEFIVTAPAHYQVVANGVLIEELDLPGEIRRTHWKQSVPIASWLYAVGIARFATHHYDVVRGVPQQVWVFPQDAQQGYKVFEFTGRRAFEYFSDWIGPYSYEKLAHVEAAGISGGMEAATAIMYGEKGVTQGRAPVVHEVAHQWWGNAVTESDWDDVWLSEGFATYFTHLFTEQFGGRDAFVKEMKDDIPVILETQSEHPGVPIVHSNLSDMSKVLNALVYRKGGWTLHMLRGIIGTETFWSGIREYYRRYRDRNASTADFRQVMEQASGQQLSWFFDQWLNRAGIPEVSGGWRYDAAAKQIQVELSQTQTGDIYRLPIEIGVAPPDGQVRVERVELTGRTGRFVVKADAEPRTVTLDPNTWVLIQPGPFVRR